MARPGLRILFCGINPSLYSAAVGHHFARPGNRFWKTLHAAGITPRLLSPCEDQALLEAGCGITNLVGRATASAAELSVEELRAARSGLEDRIIRWAPAVVAFLGIASYRTAFERPHAVPGPQSERIGATRVWLLPNPSGLNAHYQLPELARALSELDRAICGVPRQVSAKSPSTG